MTALPESGYVSKVRKHGMTKHLYAVGKDNQYFSDTCFEHISVESYDKDLMSEAATAIVTEGFMSTAVEKVKSVFSRGTALFSAIRDMLKNLTSTDYADTAMICTCSQVTAGIEAMLNLGNLISACTAYIKQSYMASQNGLERITSTIEHGIDNLKWPFGEFDVTKTESGEIKIEEGRAVVKNFSQFAAEHPRKLKDLGWTPDTVEHTKTKFLEAAEEVNKKWGAFSHQLVSVDIDPDTDNEELIQKSYGSLIALDSFTSMVTSATTALVRETFSQIYKRSEKYAKKA